MLHLKKTLDRFYKDFDFRKRIAYDPIAIPRRYSDPEDIEVAAFISSCFAYGKVGLFTPVIENILKPGTGHPAEFIANFSLKKDVKYLQGISYRFNREKDILCFIYILSEALRKYGTLKDLFYSHFRSDHVDIKKALTGFVDSLTAIDTSAVYGSNIRPAGLKHLLPSPATGSACKRMNLFLRWVVRHKDIDFGLWDEIPPSKLIIPLDIHIARISICLGLSRRKSPDWKMAEEITDSLKKLEAGDPLKYDFALCHQGISGLCKGTQSSDICLACSLLPGSAQ
ncbi:MAG: TIGR02757 family protein [Nitrospiraceae bacterium]|nr:MAG: TIGR02757 family protein [Nitrospiraceae bacterium]